MHLMIDINGEQKHYSFAKKNTISIGRGTTCDIQLNTDGISRHHADIINKNGDFFIMDKGSTNGTFINEERLAVNELASFNTFFPARLGFYVMVHLLDEVPQDVAVIGVANTNTNSLASLSNANTPHGIRRPRAVTLDSQDKTNTGIIQVKTTDFKVLIGLLFTIGVLIYMNIEHFQEYFKPVMTEEVAITKLSKTVPNIIEVKQKIPDPAKLEAELLAQANDAMMKDKCFVDEERKLCELLKKNRPTNHTEGVYISLGKLYFFTDLGESKKFYDEAFGNYGVSELNRLLLILKRSKVNVNIKELQEKGDYIFGEVSPHYNLYKLYMLLDFTRADFVEEILNSTNIDELYLVGHELENGVPRAKKVMQFSKADLRKINTKEAFFALRVAVRSHYYNLVDQLFKGIDLK